MSKWKTMKKKFEYAFIVLIGLLIAKDIRAPLKTQPNQPLTKKTVK